MKRTCSGLRAIFWFAALFALVMALVPHPPHMAYEPSDKVEHATAFATLALLGALAYPRLRLLWLLIALSLFGAFIEVAQDLPVINRDMDPLDWVADTAACGVVLVAIGLWRWRKRVA